jgi:pimeloyl-ACP methyl ester carboxylesterase
VAALNTLYDYGRGKATASQLDAAVAKTVGRPGLEDFASLTADKIVADSLYAQQPVGDPAWFLHLDPDRDALEPYRLLRCPLLVVYGRLDYTVPVEESVNALNAALLREGPDDYNIAVLDRTGHGMLVMNPDAPQSPAIPLTLALEYFALLEDWLSARGF